MIDREAIIGNLKLLSLPMLWALSFGVFIGLGTLGNNVSGDYHWILNALGWGWLIFLFIFSGAWLASNDGY